MNEYQQWVKQYLKPTFMAINSDIKDLELRIFTNSKTQLRKAFLTTTLQNNVGLVINVSELSYLNIFQQVWKMISDTVGVRDYKKFKRIYESDEWLED